MSWIVDTTMRAVGQGLDLREQRERLLVSNIANADTPLFTPMELEHEGSVASIREESAWGDLAVRTSSDRHLNAGANPIVHRDELELAPDREASLDMNRVDMDTQVTKLADNAVRYNAISEIARRKFGLLSYTISKMSGSA